MEPENAHPFGNFANLMIKTNEFSIHLENWGGKRPPVWNFYEPHVKNLWIFDLSRKLRRKSSTVWKSNKSHCKNLGIFDFYRKVSRKTRTGLRNSQILHFQFFFWNVAQLPATSRPSAVQRRRAPIVRSPLFLFPAFFQKSPKLNYKTKTRLFLKNIEIYPPLGVQMVAFDMSQHNAAARHCALPCTVEYSPPTRTQGSQKRRKLWKGIQFY